jgi:hypothetical protein
MPIGLFIHPALPLIDLAFRPILTAAKRFERTAHEKPLPGPRTRERLVVFSRRVFDSVGAGPRRVHKLLV